MKKKNNIWRFLSFFAGATSKYENQITGSDRTKIGIMGITPFIPAFMAYFAGGYFISTYYTKSPLMIWLIAAPIISFIVFVLELVIASSLSPGKPSWKKVTIAIPRIILSVLLSITLASPLKLAIFSSPIQLEMNEIQYAWIAQKEKEKGPELQRAIKNHQLMLTKEKDLSSDCKRLQSEYIDEIDGGGGSGKAGVGDISREKKDLYNACHASLNTLKDEVKQALLTKNELGSRQRITNDRAIKEYKDSFSEDLVTQLKAMEMAAEKSPAIRFFGWTILLLLILLDLTPTLNKLFTSVPSYEIAEQVDLQNTLAEQEAMSQAFIQISRLRARTHIDFEERRGEVRRLKNRLAARVRALDIALAFKQKLEGRSIMHEASDPLDLDPLKQTVRDINAFYEVSQALRNTGTDPYDPPNNEPNNPGTSTPDTPPQSQQHKPFVLKRII